nr:PspC domain-containing protein [uncultured Actinotalea sp.]
MNIHEDMRRQGLVRPQQDRVLAGVCAGLARKLGINPWGARVLFVVALVVLPGSPLVVYPILWVLMPSEDQVVRPAQPYPPQR